jgi:hypothetical protein
VLSKVGFFAFIIGFILCIVAGLAWPDNNGVIIALVILGLLIGLLNVTARETMLFLVATIALIVAGGAFTPLTTLNIGEKLGDILGYVATLMAPAAVVAAIKALWAVTKPGETGSAHLHR